MTERFDEDAFVTAGYLKAELENLIEGIEERLAPVEAALREILTSDSPMTTARRVELSKALFDQKAADPQ